MTRKRQQQQQKEDYQVVTLKIKIIESLMYISDDWVMVRV